MAASGASRVDEVFDEFRAEPAKEIAAGRVDRKRFSVMLFEYWERHADTLKLVIQADAQHALLEQLRQNLAAVTLAPNVHPNAHGRWGKSAGVADLDAQKGRPVTDPIRHAFVVDFMAGGTHAAHRLDCAR